MDSACDLLTTHTLKNTDAAWSFPLWPAQSTKSSTNGGSCGLIDRAPQWLWVRISGPAGIVSGGSELRAFFPPSIPQLRWYAWARHRTELLPGCRSIGCPLLWVCVHGVCVHFCVCSWCVCSLLCVFMVCVFTTVCVHGVCVHYCMCSLLFGCTRGSKLRPFWSHMLPKCNLCDSKIYLGALCECK